MRSFVATIKVDGRTLETKPFTAKDKEDAIRKAETKARKHFVNAEDVDCVNVEVEA